MKGLSLGLLLAAGVFFAEARAADFYVSPAGSDGWSGRLAAPCADGTDGPFATLERARDAVRELKLRKRSDIEVLLRGGLYRLDETVVFGLEDAAAAGQSISYAAFPGETPVLSSGRAITGWTQAPQDLPGLPRAARGQVWTARVSGRFSTLYDAAGRLPRARSAGFIPEEGSGRDRVRLPAAAFKEWQCVEEAEVVVRPHHAWVLNILPVRAADAAERMVYTSVDSTYVMNELTFLEGTESCWVENVLEELDEPGEWVLQRGRLYLWPRDGAAPEGITAPGLMEYIRVEGQIDAAGPADVPVRGLRFRGLTLVHGARDTLSNEDRGLQHDWEMFDKATALVRLRGAEECAVEQCRFAYSGAGAVRVDLHGQRIRIAGNVIEHIGGTGILLCGYGPGTKDVNRDNLIYNNEIHDTGEIYWHSPGIMLWQSGGNRAANNLVHDVPYAGIVVSGVMTEFFGKGGGRRELAGTIRWHEIPGGKGRRTPEEVQPYLHSRGNRIELNEIHHAMKTLADGNAVYIRGAGPGNVIRRNYIHHLVAPTALQAAIRTDGGQRDTLIEENLIYQCTSQGIKLKLNNSAVNNIIADVIGCEHNGKTVAPRYIALLEGPTTGAVLQRNILYHSGGPVNFFYQGAKTRGRQPARARDADTDFNLYWCADQPDAAHETLARAQQEGIDAHSRAADPLFVDPQHGDFRFRPGSPAAALGIVPIDVSAIGLRTE